MFASCIMNTHTLYSSTISFLNSCKHLSAHSRKIHPLKVHNCNSYIFFSKGYSRLNWNFKFLSCYKLYVIINYLQYVQKIMKIPLRKKVFFYPQLQTCTHTHTPFYYLKLIFNGYLYLNRCCSFIEQYMYFCLPNRIFEKSLKKRICTLHYFKNQRKICI